MFVDRCHHGKEEAELFPRLPPDHTVLMERLEAEHATGRQFALAFAQTIQAYLPGKAATGVALAEAARAYSAPCIGVSIWKPRSCSLQLSRRWNR